VTKKVFKSRYADVFNGDTHWRKVKRLRARPTNGIWVDLCANPPIHGDENGTRASPGHRERAHLGAVGDKITTDHISPAGSIKSVAAGQYLWSGKSQKPISINMAHGGIMRYDARNLRNIRIKNFILQRAMVSCRRRPDKHWPDGAEMPIFEAAVNMKRGVPLVVFAGRIWQWLVARLGGQGHKLLGVRAVIADPSSAFTARTLSAWASCRSLLSMHDVENLGLKGDEQVTIHGLGNTLKPAR